MERVKLTDICKPKQWKTIPTNDLLEEGFPVYGANGIIGYFSEYNHENPVVTITCRGATCGSINITVPKSYITGNAMCLDDVRQDIDISYLYYCLLHFDFSKVISGSAQPQITRQGLEKVSLSIGTPAEQESIVSILKSVEIIIKKRKNELVYLDDLIKARFVEMFGNLETNPKGWKKEPLKDHADVIVGYPFPSEGYTSDGIDIVGGYNIMQGYIQWEDSKHWPNANGYESYLLSANDIVMAMDRPWVNGGFKIARIDSEHLPAILIQRTACIRSKDVEQIFLYCLLNSSKFAEHCNITGSLVPHISNKDINSYQIILPPIEEQKLFASFVAQVDKSKIAVQKALDEAQLLFDSLMQQYFG